MLIVERMRADGIAPCSLMVGIGSLDRIGRDLTDSPATEYVGLMMLSSCTGPAGLPPWTTSGEEDDLVNGNLNSEFWSALGEALGEGDVAHGKMLRVRSEGVRGPSVGLCRVSRFGG